jgi:hypothetical protein
VRFNVAEIAGKAAGKKTSSDGGERHRFVKKIESGALRLQGDSEKLKSEVWAGLFEIGALRLQGRKRTVRCRF